MADENQQTPEGVDERPAWLPDNFKSPEDLVKSYNEAQGRVSQLSEKQQEMEETLQAVLAAQEAAQQPQEQTGYTPDQIEALYEQNPLGVTQWLIQQTAQQTMAQALQEYQQTQTQTLTPRLNATDEMAAELANNQLAARYDDWGSPEQPGYSAKVARLIEQDPTLLPEEVVHSPQKLVAKLDQIYKMAKADDLLAGNTEIQDAFAESRRAKQAAQTASGAAGRPETTGETDKDFAESLLAAHDSSWGARMGKVAWR